MKVFALHLTALLGSASLLAQSEAPAISSVKALFAEAERADLYVAKDEVDLVKLLPPAPKAGSAAEKADIKAMLDLQARRTPAQAERAFADAEVSVFRFADVLGPKFSKEQLPKFAKFFDRVLGSTFSAIDVVKKYWKRPRPFEVDPRIHPAPILRESLMLKSAQVNPSYPSGHALIGALFSIILSDMIPEMREELFARGFEYGTNRSAALVHFPSDVLAGQLGASAMAQAMMSKPSFKKDFDEAKKELRSLIR